MKRGLLIVFVAALLGVVGTARGDANTFSAVSGVAALPSAELPNGADVALAPDWLTPPVQPLQLSDGELLGIWQGAGQAYGVPWNVLAAINKIESNFGRNMGPSSAGAVGWMQFMPSTWLRWGTDADGNGTADPWNPVDAIYAAARYLAASGAAADLRRAVFAYNHADWYVNQVLELAQVYGGSDWTASDGQAVFDLDQLQAKLSEAQAKVAQASEAYQRARAQADLLGAREQTIMADAGAQALLSDRLAKEKLAGQVGVDAVAALAEADRLKAELSAAQAELAQVQSEVRSGVPAGGQVLSGPIGNGSPYVFPVGGGPTVVSVSHVHHDYPAADIAAPEGDPVYALTTGTVLYAWGWDGRCGIGFTLQAADGQVWTYCHLSYLEPSVVQGAALTAGDPVGLVGATGDATGPHLHLQLQPASSYPQEQEWFQSFAGVAFRWQDAGPDAAAAPAQPRVFHIVSLDG